MVATSDVIRTLLGYIICFHCRFNADLNLSHFIDGKPQEGDKFLPKIAVGALVLKKDFTRKRRLGGALAYRWFGPYTITCSLGQGLYHLADMQTGAVIH